MKRPQLPWTLRGSDFSQPGWHTNPTTAYQLMFEFLIVSPSYELARKARTSGLSDEEARLAPADFEQVLATYDLLGDVYFRTFRQWWLKRGLSVFGNPYTKPKVHQIALLDNGQETDVHEIAQSLQANLVEQRQAEGLSSALILSLPLGLKRSEILKLVRQTLDKHQEGQAYVEKAPKITIQGKRFHSEAMLKGLRLLWFKSAYPEWENWRLGAQTRLSGSYSSVLNPMAARSGASPVEMDDRIIMGKITHRALKRFETIAENAARGRFPSEEPVDAIDFEYPKLAQRLLKNAVWRRTNKADWLKRMQDKASQAQSNEA